MAGPTNPKANPWTTLPSHSGLVCIQPQDGQTLYLAVSGPPRTSPTTPVAIVEAGLGACSSEWLVVQRLLAPYIRTFTYDRAGYGYSASPPPTSSGHPPTGQRAAADLALLLHSAGVGPPWIIVGQSYGGLIAREFLHQQGPTNVVGMVIVDSPRGPSSMLPAMPDIPALLGGVATYPNVIGLELARARVFSAADEAALQAHKALTDAAQIEREIECMEDSYAATNAKMPLGRVFLGERGRCSVLWCDLRVDFGKVLAFARQNGFGGEEAQERLKKLLDQCTDEEGHRCLVGLAGEGRGRFVAAEGAARTHNIQMVAPEVVVKEVLWVAGIDEIVSPG